MKRIRWLMKAFLAGSLVFLLLNIFCLFYYNVPARVRDESGSVDYKWPSNAFHLTAIEGFGYGRVNNDGFSNLLDYSEDREIDVLWMGSSQGEGFNVKENENMVAVFNECSDDYAYNISISEHTLMTCLENLEAAVSKYKPKKYVVIETPTISFWDNEVESAIEDDNELDVYSSPLMDVLQNFKYAKLVYHQLNNIMHQSSSADPEVSLNDENLLDILFTEVEEICDRNNIKLLIVYHPGIEIDDSGTAHALYCEEDYDKMYNVCKNHGVELMNMEGIFIENYASTYELPYGFSNTVPGSGHLNSYGQRMIGEAVFEKLEEMENDVQ